MTENLLKLEENIPLLSYDSLGKHQLPKNYRSTNNPDDIGRLEAVNIKVNKNGITKLNISGSGQFSISELQQIKWTQPFNKVVIVDLREESHGFINDHAVSWYSIYNHINKGKAYQIIESEQQQMLKQVGFSNNVKVAHIVKEQIAPHVQYYLNEEIIEKVTSEQKLVEHYKGTYKRFYVTDHLRPRDSEIDRFVSFVASLPADKWLHFHCRGGKGRTTTFMVMYDIIKNFCEVSLEDIVARQHIIGGVNLFGEQIIAWKAPYFYERANLLKNFYRYIVENNGNPNVQWSKWIKTQQQIKPYED